MTIDYGIVIFTRNIHKPYLNHTSWEHHPVYINNNLPLRQECLSLAAQVAELRSSLAAESATLRSSALGTGRGSQHGIIY